MRIYSIVSAILISGLLFSACTAALFRQQPAPAATALANLHGNQPSEAQLLAAGEAGDVEAQRQLAHSYQPRESFGVPYGNAAEALRWYRRACAAGYANAEVDFYEFVDTQAQSPVSGAIEEAVACLDDASRQGHRKAIIDRAFRAAFVEHDYKRGYYLYALLADTEPHYAEQRHSFASQLTPAEIAAAEQAASDWRAHNRIRDYDDFFALVNSPFRQSPTPAAAPPATVPPVSARDCDIYVPRDESVGKTILCGYVTVPWDRHNPSGAKAQLAYVILKALGPNPRPDPILHVAGGPGAGVTLREAVVEFTKRYATLRQDHDIILYDQRGMGHSLPFFDCTFAEEDAPEDPAMALEQRLGRTPSEVEIQAAACEQAWAQRGFPTYALSTPTSAADLVDLMAALNYPAYNLYSVSYGTRLLMSLMHYFPKETRVRSVVLDSPFPLPEDQVNHLAGSVAAERMALLDGIFTACAADARCEQAYPDLKSRFDALVTAVTQQPLTLPDGSAVTAESLYRTLFPFTPGIGYVPYYPRLIAELEAGSGTTLAVLGSGAIPESHHMTALGPADPRAQALNDAYMSCSVDWSDAAVASAYERQLIAQWDAAPDQVAAFLMATCADGSGAAASSLVKQLPAGVFNRIISSYAPELVGGMNLMLNGKLLCTEEAPFAPEPETVADTLRQRGLPEFAVQAEQESLAELRAACAGWSDAMTAPMPATYGAYPVLILSGAFDPITPPAFAALAAKQLPLAQLVAVPNAAHSIVGNYGDCINTITAQFLADPGRTVDVTCAAQLRIPWVMPNNKLIVAPRGSIGGMKRL